MEYKNKKNMAFRHLLNFPFIWIQLFTLIILDISVEIYHQIGFRLCRISLVKRSSYIKIDRHKLKYLNWPDKLFCAYCGYANGLLRYCSEIAARTENYWCAIRHKKTKGFVEPEYQKKFIPYGDEEAYNKKYGSKKDRK